MIIETGDRPQKRKHSSPEGRIQAACFSWFWNEFPPYRGALFHVPNENDRADSNFIQGAIRKSLGVVAGVSDFILLVKRGPYGALCVEMKDEKGQQRQAQRQWQLLVESLGYRYVICRSLEDFQHTIIEYFSLCPKQ